MNIPLIVVLLIIAIVLLFIASYFTFSTNKIMTYTKFHQNFEKFIGGNSRKIRSMVDNQYYRVYGENFQESADTLAKVSAKLYELVYKLNYTDKSIKSQKRKKAATNLLKYFNSDNLKETNPDSSDTSYVDNKGRDDGDISLCIDNENFDDILFVALHELSHIACDSFGHKDEFWEIFKFLLKKAEEYNILKPKNYAKETYRYCNKIDIKYNPYYDLSIKNL